MTTLRQAAQQALECIERLNAHGWILADFEDEVYAAIAALKAALEQPEQRKPLTANTILNMMPSSIPAEYDGALMEFARAIEQAPRLGQEIEQEPTQWREMVVVTLVREGINKHKARELADHFAEQPEQKQMRMPRVGDKVICLEDESIGEVVSLTAGGSPDIKFDDGSHGTYMLREFAELFGYVTAAQRPWVELTDEEMSDIVADMDVDFGDLLWKVVCLTKIIEATLKERNT